MAHNYQLNKRGFALEEIRDIIMIVHPELGLNAAMLPANLRRFMIRTPGIRSTAIVLQQWSAHVSAVARHEQPSSHLPIDDRSRRQLQRTAAKLCAEARLFKRIAVDER